jgi:hypothetical protein
MALKVERQIGTTRTTVWLRTNSLRFSLRNYSFFERQLDEGLIPFNQSLWFLQSPASKSRLNCGRRESLCLQNTLPYHKPATSAGPRPPRASSDQHRRFSLLLQAARFGTVRFIVCSELRMREERL